MMSVLQVIMTALCYNVYPAAKTNDLLGGNSEQKEADDIGIIISTSTTSSRGTSDEDVLSA